ncbi:hypothetical protein LTR08_002860 [Meristemomyces frigidus]|nr:hypothetical protein LTR08_002860 [Meristemomyces frigidus]
MNRSDENEKGYETFGCQVVKAGGKDASSQPLPHYPRAANWMSTVDDETLLSAMTLPGTHDSAASIDSWPFVQTQKLDIPQQLNAGIRYFDLRCGIRDDIVEMVHGPSFLGITLRTLLDTMYVWLSAHKTEALIVQIKQDRKAERSSIHFAQAIWTCLEKKSAHWRTANTTPALGELRGKIQLLRRFVGSSLTAYGIDVTHWQDNPSRPFTIYTRHEVRITIQDHYSFPGPEALPSLISKKGRDVAELLDRAVADQDACHWYINFVSAYEFNFYYQLTPQEIALGGWVRFKWAHGMNIRLRNYLQTRKSKRRYGIVAMDFPESGTEDLIATLILSNFSGAKHSRLCWTLDWDVTIILLMLCFSVLAVFAWLSTRESP